MVKSVENGVSLAPFLVKCYEMVNDESTNELISWTGSNDSFIIRDELRFSSELLPKYFKHSNFSSFVRQLNIYGFRKVDTDQWEFANEAFIKGQKHLLKNITRRKHSQSLVERRPSQQKDIMNPVAAAEADRNIALWKEVESLKTDKSALTQELAKLSIHQQSSQSKLVSLREEIKGMEKNQQQMLSFIVMAMQNPEFLMQFLHPKENTAKLSEVTDDDDGMVIRYLPPNNEDESMPSCNTATPSNSADDLIGLDFTSDEIRDFLVDIDSFFGPDEKLYPTENHTPEESGNDSMLERLLLSSSSRDSDDFEDDETEGFVLSEVQSGSEFNSRRS